MIIQDFRASDVSASPFVIAIQDGGISGLASVMNSVILISVISVGSSSVYATSRTLVSLAEQNLAPKICGYVDRAGRPLVAILITNVFGLLSFIAASGKEDEVFTGYCQFLGYQVFSLGYVSVFLILDSDVPCTFKEKY